MKASALFTIFLLAVPAAAQTAPQAQRPEYSHEHLLAGQLWRATSSDVTSVDLRSGFLPAKSQGRRNMCNAFATVGLAEYLVAKREGAKQSFSEEFLFYNTKYNYTSRPELQSYKTSSGLAGYATVLALEGGLTADREWPFNPNWKNLRPVPPVTDPDVGVAPQWIQNKVLGYRFTPVAIRRAEIKNYLAEKQNPVVINLMVYSPDWNPNGSGKLHDPSEAERQQCFNSGNNCGGHVVLLVGYDAQSREYLVRNSWGTGWGENGYGRVSEKYVMENCETCHYLPYMTQYDAKNRTMLTNGCYGWSAELK